MSESIILNRDEFREVFIKPLEDAFGYKTYWNSKKLTEIGLKQISTRGTCFSSKVDSPIVLTYKKDTLDLLNTLIHEYGHACFHNKMCKGRPSSKHMKEVEAETLAKEVFRMLNLKYNEDYYINKYIAKCTPDELSIWENTRKEKVYKLASEIAKIFSNKKYVLEKLNPNYISTIVRREEYYKYKIVCPICNSYWRYKRMSKIIKTNAKNCYCPRCGESKTMNKLIVKEI